MFLNSPLLVCIGKEEIVVLAIIVCSLLVTEISPEF